MQETQEETRAIPTRLLNYWLKISEEGEKPKVEFETNYQVVLERAYEERGKQLKEINDSIRKIIK